MKVNQSKLWAIAFLAAPLMFMQDLVLAIAPRSELNSQTFSIDRDYVGDFCIILGPITQYADVIIDWGPFQGQRRVYPDGRNQNYGVNVYAKGDNLWATLYTSMGLGDGYPKIIQERCQDTEFRIENPAYLDWSDR